MNAVSRDLIDRRRAVRGGRRQFLAAVLFFVIAGSAAAMAASYHSEFRLMPDRIWAGPNVWANPMEDWRIHSGRLECTSAAPNRNVHVLTHQLSDRQASFSVAARVGLISGKTGGAGFLIGIHDAINDFRGNLFFGDGVRALVTTDGRILLDGKSAPLTDASRLENVLLRLEANPRDEQFQMTLTATQVGSGDVLGRIQTIVAGERLVGNLALVQNPFQEPRPDARFWFRDWTIDGPKVEDHPQQAFGPILFSMHTLNNSRGPDGFVLRLTAQMPPLGADDSRVVRLDVDENDRWTTLETQKIDPDSRTATFHVPLWPAERDVSYRLVYALKTTDGQVRNCFWSGTIHHDPRERPLVVPGFTGHFYRGFPFGPVVRNVAGLNPDLLFFSGDQIYEPNGGYGIVREPAERAILCYLRKWYLFGWTWRELTRDHPAVCLPDDHDVFHGNLWGEGGERLQGSSTSSYGGYAEPIRMVNVVHRTQCAHQPLPYNPAPALRGLTVYYTDLVYGRVSFALLADRQFKSGPENVKTDSRRADWVDGPDFDISKLDKTGLTLLGDRQLEFLNHWVRDWRGADMKVVLSQTVFANAATHHGQRSHYLQADLDSGGWPQSARDRAIRLMRKAYPLHYNGDQHLASLIQYGVDAARDSGWSFCTPAVCSIYQRWWHPDEAGRPHTDRPAHGLPDTGEYRDGLGNRIFVYAVANPKATGTGSKNRYDWADARAGGFANLIIDTTERTYTCQCFHFLADLQHPTPSDQFPGWPLTIRQRENYGRKIFGYLPEVSIENVEQAVLEVTQERTGELVYALRLTTNRVKPWIFESGRYTVRLGDPDAGIWRVFNDQRVR